MVKAQALPRKARAGLCQSLSSTQPQPPKSYFKFGEADRRLKWEAFVLFAAGEPQISLQALVAAGAETEN